MAPSSCGNSKGISDAKRDNIRAKREAKKAAERAKAAADAAGRASDSDSYSDSDSDSDSAPEACNNEFKSTSHYGERYVREGRETMHERDELYGTGESMELDDNLDIGTSFSLPDRTRAQPQQLMAESSAPEPGHGHRLVRRKKHKVTRQERARVREMKKEMDEERRERALMRNALHVSQVSFLRSQDPDALPLAEGEHDYDMDLEEDDEIDEDLATDVHSRPVGYDGWGYEEKWDAAARCRREVDGWDGTVDYSKVEAVEE